jgi:hypothetical protein
VIALLPVIAVTVAFVHGLLPGRLAHLPVAFAYSGLIECLSDQGVLRLPVCERVGMPVGHVPLTDGPYLQLAATFRAVTGVDALEAKRFADMTFFLLSFLAMVALQLRLGVNLLVAVLMAACFLNLPIVVGHAGIFSYDMGMLLLPVYLLADHLLYARFESAHAPMPGGVRMAAVVAGYAGLRTLSLFQDAYTAVMWVAVSAVFLAFAAWRGLARRRRRDVVVLSLNWLLSVVVAVGLYKAYVPGGANFTVMPLDFFRAQGVDLISLVVPSHRLWWSKALDIGVARWDALAHWGDGLNVSYNYLGYALLVPVSVYVAGKLWRGPRRALQAMQWHWAPLLVAALLAFIVSLGPSIKINDAREDAPAGPIEFADYLMPREAATLTLPSEALFRVVPGINNMRAINRWIIVPQLILLLGFAAVATRLWRRSPALSLLLVSLAMIELFPDIAALDAFARGRFRSWGAFNEQLVPELREGLAPGSRVFFLSGENDILANYLAPVLEIRAYNVGGDKNHIISAEQWPAGIRALRARAVTLDGVAPAIAAALEAGDVDVVVLPYFNMRWNAFVWPPAPRQLAARRQALEPHLAALPQLNLVRSELFVLARSPRASPASAATR